jgi:hypothetical protein
MTASRARCYIVAQNIRKETIKGRRRGEKVK